MSPQLVIFFVLAALAVIGALSLIGPDIFATPSRMSVSSSSASANRRLAP